MINVSKKKIRHINEHLTPLALLIVVPGLLVGRMPNGIRIACGLLIAYSLLMNYLTSEVLHYKSGALAKLRVGSNYAVNIVLLWLLYQAWPIVWILFLLTAYGLAVYQNRSDSLRSACAIALLLLVVHGVMGPGTVEAWTVAGIRAAVIVISTPFIHGLLELSAKHA